MTKLELIKELRLRTGAGMADCGNALSEADGDLEKAIDIIKVKGQNIVSSRQGKLASEGVIAISQASHGFSMVEVNCQTDFVANHSDFKKFATNCAQQIMLSSVQEEQFDITQVEQERQQLVSTTKENIVVRRWWIEEVMQDNCRVFSYVHLGSKIGVLLSLMAPTVEMANSKEFEQLGNDLTMQIAAMKPIAIFSEKITQDVLDRQKSIFETQLKEMNKPQAAWSKIIDGKMNKWFAEACLLNQESIVHPKTSVQQVIEKLDKDIVVLNFIRAEVGEGLENSKDNLAEEVAKLM